jgi:hypothetical protein
VQAYNKRLTVLSEEERLAMYGMPDFSKEQQKEYFTFTKNEIDLIFSRTNISAQIYCALQIGYFKAKQIFFEFSWIDISNEDVNFLIKMYFGGKNISLNPITKYEHYTQINQISRLNNYNLWSNKFRESLYFHILKTSKKDMNIKFILTELISYLFEKRIVLPGYSTLQKIIGKALNDEYARLDSIITNSITEESKAIIEKLLAREDLFSYLAVLKQDAKNFGYKMMVSERQKLSVIKPLYILAKELLPKLDISRQNLLRYAELVDYYTIFKLRRFSQERLHLYLLCYTWRRYMQLTDNLVDAFTYHLKQFDDEAKESAEENFTEQSRSQQGNMSVVGKLLHLYVDKKISDNMTFGEIRNKYAFSLMQEEDINKTAQQMIHKPISEHALKWKAVDKISYKFKKHLRAIFMELDFTSFTPKNPLMAVIEQLKQSFSNQKSINKNNIGEYIKIIPKKLKQHLLIYDTSSNIIGIHQNRYEFWMYRQITKSLVSGEIHLDDSISHRCFENELVPLDDNEMNQLDLPCLKYSIEEQLDDLYKELKKQWKLFDKIIKSNKMNHIQYDTNTKSLSFHRPKTSNIEESENVIYSKLPSVDITDVMRFVNDSCNFLSAFNPIQTRYTKSNADENSLLAVIISQAMNHGNLKLGKISDIPYQQLLDVYYKYFRKATLQDANKIISMFTLL